MVKLKVKGALLIESITAMVLVLITATVVFTFLTNTTSANFIKKKKSAFFAVNSLIFKIKKENIQESFNTQYDDMNIECNIYRVKRDENIYFMNLVCEQSGQKVLSHSEFYKITDN